MLLQNGTTSNALKKYLEYICVNIGYFQIDKPFIR